MAANRYMLVDADILIYNMAASVQEEVCFNGHTSYYANINDAAGRVEYWAQNVQNKIGPVNFVMCLSCPTGRYFRHDAWPDYKAQRKGLKKPELVGALRDFIVSEYTVAVRPGLEADDVLGILATGDALRGKKCIATIDKDLDQIPGAHMKMFDPNCELYSVSPVEGYNMHLIQTLTGDTIDNYPGCPGVGPKGAAAVVREQQQYVLNPACFSRGPRKGESKGLWDLVPADNKWDGVVSCFQKHGLDIQDALRQARLAKILTADLWDGPRQQVIDWNPPVVEPTGLA